MVLRDLIRRSLNVRNRKIRDTGFEVSLRMRLARWEFVCQGSNSNY
jgi:hypothetical protein